jgi:hypothetical protein
MRATTLLRIVLSIYHVFVRSLELREDGLVAWVAPQWRVPRCSNCGTKCTRVHSKRAREWRHLDCCGWKDQDLVARALTRGGFPYLGLIGSDRKWSRFRTRLLQRGFTEEQLATVRCPIGVTKGSKEPRAIALSVALELVARGVGVDG